MFNISLDVDYLNIYRQNQNLPLSEEKDAIITKGLERVCNLFSDFNFKATFFIIGASIKYYKSYYLNLIEDGNEIGNHTMEHANLFELSHSEQERQIFNCQEVIRKELNYQSIGFKAPGYNVSSRIYQILLQQGIKYDASCFNNILLPLAKMSYHLRLGKGGFGRTAFGTMSQMFQSPKIHKRGELYIIPVGSTIFKLPFYGGFHAACPILARLSPPEFAFTYLIHPIEFLENGEIGELKTGYKTTLSERVKIYSKIFKKLKESQRRCLLLRNLIMELEHENN